MLSMKHKKHIRMGDKLLTYCFLKWKYLQYVINCLKGLKQFLKNTNMSMKNVHYI